MKLVMVVACLVCAATTFSQTKIFKEVSNEISSQMKIITQDEALIGYLMFTQLEKASKDSFNYQVSIMDENLNDIGKLDFREKNLELQAVSFDQDILCLVYLKSDIADLKSTSMKEIRRSVDEGKNSVFTQLINLHGQIVYTGSQKVDLTLKESISYEKQYGQASAIAGRLKHPVILKNIPGKGFAVFYGDDNKNRLIALDITGKELWQKPVPEQQAFGMLTTANDIYLMTKKKHEMLEGGYDVRGYNAVDGSAYDKYDLRDKSGNQLKVLGFETDPTTGRPLITGTIINSSHGNRVYSVRDLHKGPYDGVFTIMLNGPKKSDIKERFSYWNDGSKEPDITTTGEINENKLYPYLVSTVRDYKGNTYYVGSSYKRKVRVGAIISSVVLAPLIVPPIFLMAGGTHKARQTDVVLFRQDSLGRLRYENSIDGDESRYIPSSGGFGYYQNRSFYTVKNADTHSNFLIVDESKGATIYNVENRKVVRNVPHKDGNIRTYIFPAKEGHIMVVETDRKAKETKLSIEALQ